MPHNEEQDHPQQGTLAEALFASLIAGTVGGYTAYPWEALKKKAESGQSLPSIFNPREIFRGASPFALTLGPVSLVQGTLNDSLKRLLPENAPESSKYGIGLISGLGGAFVSAPVEATILAQQLQKTGPIGAIRYLFSQGYSRPWSALKPLMIREAGFGFTWLMGADAAGDYASKQFGVNWKFPATIMVGLAAALVTHPFDVTATRIQQTLSPISMHAAMKQIYQELGWKGFLKGYEWRALLFTSCMIVIGNLEKFIQKELGQPSVLGFFGKKENPQLLDQAKHDENQENQESKNKIK